LKGSQTSFEEKHEKTAKNRTKNNLRNRWVEKKRFHMRALLNFIIGHVLKTEQCPNKETVKPD
jgi:hypothetical protein